MSSSVQQLAEKLIRYFSDCAGCIVAFSGGVDSAVVARAAAFALGENSLAVTATSASLSETERNAATETAKQIGIRHRWIATSEFENPNYLKNDERRCYHCKTELYSQLKPIQQQHPQWILVNGANLDDQTDYRPGLQAAAEHQVRSPLAECGLTKQQVRDVAKFWNLSVWDKPAAPCLSSRIAYGQTVSPERLRMIEAAERFLKDHGFGIVRVRYHEGDVARIEIPCGDFVRLLEADLFQDVQRHLAELGFRFVTLDLAGFRSGSLNSLVPVEVLAASGRVGS
ncbi:MAG: ATP-dependent sacrificial sulfur transferase LarE [Planctomycetales bacterium]|nr:ATP-dependent sacrificial sulfur transferase LarE [Planctomycetales bacterium]